MHIRRSLFRLEARQQDVPNARYFLPNVRYFFRSVAFECSRFPVSVFPCCLSFLSAVAPPLKAEGSTLNFFHVQREAPRFPRTRIGVGPQ